MQLLFLRFDQKFLYRNKCPDTQRLAAYAERRLIGPQRHAVESHLATCDRCIQQVAFLLESFPEETSVPTETMNKAFALAKRDVGRSYAISTLAWSGAFVLLLVAIISWRVVGHQGVSETRSRGKGSSPEASMMARVTTAPTPATTNYDLVRGNDDAGSAFLFPSTKETVDASNLVFRWKNFPQAAHYEIELMADDGTIIWTAKARSTSAALPPSVQLLKGGTYFVRLRIRTVNGSTEVTRAIEFIAQ